MSRPVPDKAEVALEYPDKFYVGTFEHSSRFEARLDGSGVALVLQHPGAADERKSVHLHLNFGLLAGILRELAVSVAALPQGRHRTPRAARGRARRIAPGAADLLKTTSLWPGSASGPAPPPIPCRRAGR
ncbi:hypothetical protein ABIF95_006009 [Bradyrhizobium ottawaense]